MFIAAVLLTLLVPLVAYNVFLRRIAPAREDLQNPFDSFEKQASDSFQLWIYGMRGKKVAQALLSAGLLGTKSGQDDLSSVGENDLFTLEGTYNGAPLMFSYSVSNDLRRYAQWPAGTPRIIVAIGDQVGAKDALLLFEKITKYIREKFQRNEWAIEAERLSILTYRRHRPVLMVIIALTIASLALFCNAFFSR